MMRRLSLCFVVIAGCGTDGFPNFELLTDSVRFEVNTTAPEELATLEFEGRIIEDAEHSGGTLSVSGWFLWGPDFESWTTLRLDITPERLLPGEAVTFSVANSGTTNGALTPLCGEELDANIRVGLVRDGTGTSVGINPGDPVTLNCR